MYERSSGSGIARMTSTMVKDVGDVLARLFRSAG